MPVARMERSVIRDNARRRASGPGLRCASSGLRDRACVAVCQSIRAKIFRFTEIRKYRMSRPSRLILEGRSCGRHCREPGLAVDAAASCARGQGQGGLLSVSPGHRADERRCQVRLVCKFPALSTGLGKLRRNGGPCVRQNRVVLAVVATVKLLRMRQSRQPARRLVTFAGVREARTNSAPGRARHKPSDHRAGKAE